MKLNCQKVWSDCLNYIKQSIDVKAVETWFIPIVPVKLEDSVLTIQVPNRYFYEVIEEQYIQTVGMALRKVLGEKAQLNYALAADEGYKSNSPQNAPNTQKGNNSADAKSLQNPFVIPGAAQIDVDPQLNLEYNFDNYVEGECNKLAKAASMTIAQNPGHATFNPLYIYGGSGLGKTHLAQAIGVEVKKNFPDKRVLYVNANRFQTQYTDSYLKRNINDFVNFYQLIDVLIIDDIHEFIGKPGTQNTFFHIFNHLHQNNKQLIFTCDQPPAKLEGMEERLLNRFKWGLSAEIEKPNYETRKNILLNKIIKDGIRLSDEVVHYLASHIDTNVRELEGALISLLFMATMDKKEVSLETAQSVVEKIVKKTQRELSIDLIQEKVCKYYGIDLDILHSNTRRREVVQARQIAMYFSKNLTNSSLATIGAKIGDKNHSTVLYACRTVDNLIETDRDFKLQMKEIEVHLKS